MDGTGPWLKSDRPHSTVSTSRSQWSAAGFFMLIEEGASAAGCHIIPTPGLCHHRAMNYRHGFHAGNFADVVKHSLLLLLLEALVRKPAPGPTSTATPGPAPTTCT